MESTYLLTYLGLRCDWSPTLSVSKIRFASQQTRIKFYEEFLSFILRNKQERIKTIPCSPSSRGFRNRERGGSETLPQVTFHVSDKGSGYAAFSPLLQNASSGYTSSTKRKYSALFNNAELSILNVLVPENFELMAFLKWWHQFWIQKSGSWIIWQSGYVLARTNLDKRRKYRPPALSDLQSNSHVLWGNFY